MAMTRGCLIWCHALVEGMHDVQTKHKFGGWSKATCIFCDAIVTKAWWCWIYLMGSTARQNLGTQSDLTIDWWDCCGHVFTALRSYCLANFSAQIKWSNRQRMAFDDDYKLSCVWIGGSFSTSWAGSYKTNFSNLGCKLQFGNLSFNAKYCVLRWWRGSLWALNGATSVVLATSCFCTCFLVLVRNNVELLPMKIYVCFTYLSFVILSKNHVFS